LRTGHVPESVTKFWRATSFFPVILVGTDWQLPGFRLFFSPLGENPEKNPGVQPPASVPPTFIEHPQIPSRASSIWSAVNIRQCDNRDDKTSSRGRCQPFFSLAALSRCRCNAPANMEERFASGPANRPPHARHRNAVEGNTEGFVAPRAPLKEDAINFLRFRQRSRKGSSLEWKHACIWEGRCSHFVYILLIFLACRRRKAKVSFDILPAAPFVVPE